MKEYSCDKGQPFHFLGLFLLEHSPSAPFGRVLGFGRVLFSSVFGGGGSHLFCYEKCLCEGDI